MGLFIKISGAKRWGTLENAQILKCSSACSKKRVVRPFDRKFSLCSEFKVRWLVVVQVEHDMSKLHRNCVVPGCTNRRDRCKWGLFPREEKVGGHQVYVKGRLCGINNCRNQSSACQDMTFARIPKDCDKRRAL